MIQSLPKSELSVAKPGHTIQPFVLAVEKNGWYDNLELRGIDMIHEKSTETLYQGNINKVLKQLWSDLRGDYIHAWFFLIVNIKLWLLPFSFR